MDAGQPSTSGNETNNNRTNRADNATRPTISFRQDVVNGDSGGGGGSAGGAGGAATTRTGTSSTTMVLTQQNAQSIDNNEVLRLSLRPRSNVTWDQAVVNNEGLGRKSSKRCCIFHKQRPFGESSTESSEDDNGDDDGSTSSSSSGGGGGGNAQQPVAQKNNGKKMGGISKNPKVPDSQRFHA